MRCLRLGGHLGSQRGNIGVAGAQHTPQLLQLSLRRQQRLLRLAAACVGLISPVVIQADHCEIAESTMDVELILEGGDEIMRVHL